MKICICAGWHCSLLFVIFVRLFRQVRLHTTVQLLSCIVTHLLLSMIDCRSFTDNCKVTSRTNRQGMAYNFIAKELCIFLLQAKAVIFIIFLPIFQLDDKVDLLFFLYTLNTKQSLYIDNTDTSQFDKVSGDVR